LNRFLSSKRERIEGVFHEIQDQDVGRNIERLLAKRFSVWLRGLLPGCPAIFCDACYLSISVLTCRPLGFFRRLVSFQALSELPWL